MTALSDCNCNDYIEMYKIFNPGIRDLAVEILLLSLNMHCSLQKEAM
jgi:hypothetical protein